MDKLLISWDDSQERDQILTIKDLERAHYSLRILIQKSSLRTLVNQRKYIFDIPKVLAYYSSFLELWN